MAVSRTTTNGKEHDRSRNGRQDNAKARFTTSRKYRNNVDDDHLTINQTKTRLRSVKRLLANKASDMPGGQQQSLEREHATLQTDLQDLLQKSQYKKLISRYHKIRFFERRKAERALKRAQKNTEKQSQDDTNRSKSELHERQTDLNYTLYYPLSRPYVSLYTRDQASEDAPNRSSPIWKEVETAMRDNTLEQLRNRPLSSTTLPANYASARPERKSTNGAKFSIADHKRRSLPADTARHTPRRARAPPDADDDENGEFFFDG